MKVLIKDQKEMLEIKNTVTEMKNAFDGLIITKLGIAEGRINELEEKPVYYFKVLPFKKAVVCTQCKYNQISRQFLYL